MNHVEVGQQTPAAVNLGIVAIGFGNDQGKSADEERRGESRHERVSLKVDLLQAVDAEAIFKQSVWKSVKLREKGRYCLGVIGTVLNGCENRDTHREQRYRVDDVDESWKVEQAREGNEDKRVMDG